MSDVLIRRVPDPVVKALKQRAEKHGRSLQQELLQILREAATRQERRFAAEIASEIRQRLSKSGRTFSDSAELVRDDRER